MTDFLVDPKYEKHNDISDEYLAIDIADTEHELMQIARCQDAWEVLANNDLNELQRRMHRLRAGNARSDMTRGADLLVKLKALQDYRRARAADYQSRLGTGE